MKSIICLCFSVLLISFNLSAQVPLWQGKGRIAISSDGNEHDHDDWAATPLSLALLSAAGLQDKLVIYTYSDHIWGSNQDKETSPSGLNAYEHMRESAVNGGKWFGFGKTRFICAVDNAEVAYRALKDEINRSTAADPLIIIAAGPMQVAGEAISRADISKRRFVTIVSHSNWNNNHSDKPENEWWDKHTGWTFREITDSFSGSEGGRLRCIQIADQNGGTDYEGLHAPIKDFDWIKTSPARNNPIYKPGSWDWLYSRIQTCVKTDSTTYDASDAGMIIYLLTGIEKTDPSMAKKIMEK